MKRLITLAVAGALSVSAQAQNDYAWQQQELLRQQNQILRQQADQMRQQTEILQQQQWDATVRNNQVPFWYLPPPVATISTPEPYRPQAAFVWKGFRYTFPNTDLGPLHLNTIEEITGWFNDQVSPACRTAGEAAATTFSLIESGVCSNRELRIAAATLESMLIQDLITDDVYATYACIYGLFTNCVYNDDRTLAFEGE